MNKKELNELRRNFAADSDLFVVNHVITAFVDGQKEIHGVSSRAYRDIPTEEMECLIATLKRTLSGKIGRGLIEYEFPNDAYEEDGIGGLLYTVTQAKLLDETATTTLIDRIVQNFECVSSYAILLAHCTYTVFQKTRNDEIDPYQSVDYSFIVAAICPVSVRVDGLIYNTDSDLIQKKNVYDMIVAEVPTDGFLYPTFTGRGADVNHVLYYAHKPKEISVSMVEDVLGCQFTQTADAQKEMFQQMLQDIVSDELDYTTVTSLNDKLRDLAGESANDPEPMAVDAIHVRDMLLDSGVSEEKAEQMKEEYARQTQDKPIMAENLAQNKTTLALEGITVTIGKGYEDKVRTREVDGRRFLLIDLDGGDVQVNGMTATVVEKKAFIQETSDAEGE